MVATKSNKFGLNTKQIKLAETLANPEFRGNITELCSLCGVARSTFYKWMDHPAFRAYLDNLIHKYTDSELSTVWRALIKRCSTGDVQAIRLYFELRDKGKSDNESGVQIIDDL